MQTADEWCFGKSSVEAAILSLQQGRPVVVVDDLDRENEGDLIYAGELIRDSKWMNFIITHTSGVICVALPEFRLRELQIPQMVQVNEDNKQTAYGVSVDCQDYPGKTTGISAPERAITVKALSNFKSSSKSVYTPPRMARTLLQTNTDGHIQIHPEAVERIESYLATSFDVCETSNSVVMKEYLESMKDLDTRVVTSRSFTRPGHVFPLQAVHNGVLARRGHTEASVDLCRLAGLAPCAALCEVVDTTDPHGLMAKVPQLIQFAHDHSLVLTSIHDMVLYRLHINDTHWPSAWVQ